MFERPEEALLSFALGVRDRRSSAAICQHISSWIANDPVAESRSFAAGTWLGDGLLDLCHSRLDGASLAALAPAFASQRLKHAFLCSNRLGPETALALPRSESIASVWLGDNQLGPRGVSAVFDRYPNARALWLSRAAIGDRGAEALCAHIAAAPALIALDIAGCELSEEACVAVVRAARDRGLSALSIDGNRIGPRAARSLADALARWPALTLLRLNATSLGDEGAALVCSALATAPSLVALGLSSNGLSDDAAHSVAALVEASATLRALELGFVPVEHHSGAKPNELTDRGAAAVLSAAAARRALRSIELRGAAIPEDAHEFIVTLVADSGSVDALVHEATHRGPLGDALRAALARNANRARPRENAVVRELLAPLRRWRSQQRDAVTAPALASSRAPAQLCPAPSDDDVERALRVIDAIRSRAASGAALTDAEQRLRAVATRAWSRPTAHDQRRTSRTPRDERAQLSRARDSATLASTTLRGASPEARSPGATLEAPQKCYACRREFVHVDAHYDRLCPDCAAINHQRRAQRADLTGCVALVTGARVHIGFHTTLSLLRSGCAVIATSRFVNDAWARFASEPDFDRWRGLLELRPLDLRFARDVERFADALCDERGAIDVLVNNAAQTIARAPAYYAALRTQDATVALPEGVRPVSALAAADTVGDATLGSVALEAVVEDLRRTNSWRHEIDDVSVGELLSAHAVNAIAPYVLVARLRAALAAAAERRGRAFVVNVSSIEGQFAQRRKPSRHPHTNMAKAALNMLTRTVADSFATERILVCSVDPGWVSAQNPFAQDAAMRASGFSVPLGLDDSAARVLDPIYRAKLGAEVEHGVLFKDYAVAPW